MAITAAGCVKADQPADPVVLDGGPAKEFSAASGEGNGFLLPERKGPMELEGRFDREKGGLSIWRSLGATMFVLGVLAAVNLYIRKGKFGKLGRTESRIRLLERFAVDQKRSLMLVEVDGQKVLLGVGNDSISRVMSFDELDEAMVEPFCPSEVK